MSPRTDRAAAGSRLDSSHHVCGPTIQAQEPSLFLRSWVVVPLSPAGDHRQGSPGSRRTHRKLSLISVNAITLKPKEFDMSDPMADASSNDRPVFISSSLRRNSIGAWIVVTVLMLLLVASGVIAYLGWMSGGDADVPTSGYVAMAFGVIFSLAVGIGLMALIFYSSRKGYDEPAVLIQEPSVDPDDVQKKPATKP